MRNQRDYRRLSRWQILNHFRTEWTKAKPENRISRFLQKYFWTWIYHTLKSRFGPKYPYPVYTTVAEGIHQADAEITIGVTADWATDTLQSCAVTTAMGRHTLDYTIHLGDTYFVGTPPEIKLNFLGPDCPWIRGRKGSFALLGNHEMYARGISYFRDLLPELGLKENGRYQGQKAAYFCLETQHWRILALDTGYNSIGIPILEFLPFLSPDCHFEPSLVEWLREALRMEDPSDSRSLVILTHHQFITAFRKESEYDKPAKQLADAIGRKYSVLWLWGHEHKFSMYEKAAIDDNVTVYGRCIGHGGMPIELLSKEFKRSTSSKGRDKLVMVDRRVCKDHEAPDLGHNGYALLKIAGPQLTVEYHDTHQLLVTETWMAGPEGICNGKIDPIAGSGLYPEPNKKWQDLVSRQK